MGKKPAYLVNRIETPYSYINPKAERIINKYRIQKSNEENFSNEASTQAISTPEDAKEIFKRIVERNSQSHQAYRVFPVYPIPKQEEKPSHQGPIML